MAKAIFAGVILEFLSARFKASMAASNAGMASSRPLGCWDPAFIVETWGGGTVSKPYDVEAVRKIPGPQRTSVHFFDTPRTKGPFGEGNCIPYTFCRVQICQVVTALMGARCAGDRKLWLP